MTDLDKEKFLAWAYGDLLTNTTRGALAEYIVATALRISDTPRVQWDQYDLEFGGVKVEVKSAAYVQAWKQPRLSKIVFGIRPAQGWDSRTDTYATSAQRCADVYVFCLLEEKDSKIINPLDVAQWQFYVLSKSELDRKVPDQKTIGLGRLKALGVQNCRYDELKAAVVAATAGKSA